MSHYQPRHDRFISRLTGKEYPFTPGNPASRRAAEATVKADIAKLRQAADQRAIATLGRPMTDREFVNDKLNVPETRTIREQVESETTHMVSTHDADADPYASRIASLNDSLAHEFNTGRRNRLLERLARATEASAHFVQQRDARKAHEAAMAHHDVQTYRVLMESTCALFRVSHDPAMQPLLERAQAALNKLNTTGNADECRAEYDAIEATRKQILGDRAKTLAAQADDLREQAGDVRKEKRTSIAAQADALIQAIQSPPEAKPETAGESIAS